FRNNNEMNHYSEIKDLRIVLLGSRGAGKSWSGNTILAGEQFGAGRTAQCVSGQAEVRGRRLTVVDTPGWWKSLVKQEIVSSLSLCPPGPHALLLVLRADIAFPNQFGAAILEHLSLISERVWDHTIVLFTRGDYLGDRPIEQYIESEGEALQWLTEMCGNRYHVFNNRNRSDGSQVTELHEKIEEMVARNGGRCYEIGRQKSQMVKLNWNSRKERKWRKLLVGKCGNRYHVFNNKNRGDGSQVTELLEKIEDMVAGKSDFPLSNASNSTSNLPHGE
uniref:AIG1-type G domain-containing protein n=1 Tax=Myripristis murdjan TaxID=586833 RepID=A0A667WXM7_9TELE